MLNENEKETAHKGIKTNGRVNKTLKKLDGSVVVLGRGKPRKNWEKQADGNYLEKAIKEDVGPVTESSSAN